MEFTVLTIFPEMFGHFWENGIIKRAIDAGRIAAETVNIRDFARDRHRTVDDRPFGGGCGMVMKPEPLTEAIRAAGGGRPSVKTVLLTPQGRPFNQGMARELSACPGLILICGRYEGVDERICDMFVDEEVSIGDFVLTGGELAAMMVIDAVTRLLPGVLGGAESAEKDSFSDNLLEHGHYTRPREFEGRKVPEVLLSGNHRDIALWRLETSLIRTLLKRPDLMLDRSLDPQEVRILEKWQKGLGDLIHANRKG